MKTDGGTDDQDEAGRLPEDGRAMEWRPHASGAGILGVCLALLLLSGAAAAFRYAAGHPIGLDSFAGIVAGLAALLLGLSAGILAYGYYSMRYRLDDRVLSIAWLWIREAVPLGSIEGLYRGHRLGKRAEVDGLNWPGQYVGTAVSEGLGPVKFYGTTQNPSNAIVVATAGATYALTPADLAGFREHLIKRLEALPEAELELAGEPTTMMPSLLRLSIFGDGTLLALFGVGLLVLLTSFGYASARFPDLPELMALHFNAAGEPDLVGPARDVFRMPIIGALILAANLALAAMAHRWRRDAARVLAAATVGVELVMLVAVLRVVH